MTFGPSTQRLIKALEDRNNPRLKNVIRQAKRGLYDEFNSTEPFPISTLVADLEAFGELELAKRAKEGEFDAEREEHEAWQNSLEGMSSFSDPIAVADAKKIAKLISEANGIEFDEAEFDQWVKEHQFPGMSDFAS